MEQPWKSQGIMFLTREEAIALTGKKQRVHQVAALNMLDITHKVRPDGFVLVLRSHVEHVFGGCLPSPEPKLHGSPTETLLPPKRLSALGSGRSQTASKEKAEKKRTKLLAGK